MDYLPLIAIGLFAGVCAGMFGIGGGLVIGPLLIVLLKLPIKEAVGTSLGVVTMPTVILGTIEHWKAGNVHIKYSLLIACGVFVGAYFGARLNISMSPGMIKRVYGAFLFFFGARMLLWGK